VRRTPWRSGIDNQHLDAIGYAGRIESGPGSGYYVGQIKENRARCPLS